MIKWFLSLLCTHKNQTIVKYETRNNQEIHLRPMCQYWRCNDCFKRMQNLSYSFIVQKYIRPTP